jgi:hypothetical protein
LSHHVPQPKAVMPQGASRPWDGMTKIHGVGYSPSWPGWVRGGAGTQTNDSDFASSAFQALWNTPRVNVGGPSLLSDFQVMNQTGFNLIRLYDWNPQRGFDSSGNGTSDHIQFLDEAQANGMKVLVPVSNYNLGDDIWGPNGRPDDSYSFASAPPAVQTQLNYFIKSITRNGQIDPAVFGFEIGNEIDLNSGDWAHGDMTLLTQRSLWWVVNLQSQLNQDPSDPNRLRFTIPVSNADQGAVSLAKRSWFQVFRDGAANGSYTPLGPDNGTTFNRAVVGLAQLKGADWYETWFFNSYQTFHTGISLQELLEQYATGGDRGHAVWSKQWPGEKFDVPLLLTELGSKLVVKNKPVEAISEEAYSNQVAQQQALVAERFLRSEKGNPSFIGYTIFEFNDEPNKNGYDGPNPTVETNRGIFKYYNTRNVFDFRTGTVVTNANTGPTKVPYDPYTLAPMNYPIYQLNWISHSSYWGSLNKAIGLIFKGEVPPAGPLARRVR